MKKIIALSVVVLILVVMAVVVTRSRLAQVFSASQTATSTVATSTPAEDAMRTPPASDISLSVTPRTITQGDPVMVSLAGGSLTDIQSASVSAPGAPATGQSAFTPLLFSVYKGAPAAFYGSGIDQKTGTAGVRVTLKDGTVLSGSFDIALRTKPSEDLPVPPQLGGNSTSSQEALVSNLAEENAEVAAVPSDLSQSFWSTAFAYPVSGPLVTDPYGYDRESGAETIVHKGTDFRAPPGTPVYAVNDGVVRAAKLFSVYGNTVIVDHGLGIQSFYMHLSKMSVSVGETVTKGELVGYSGETGYAEGPHLHLTIRINGSSVDPMKFYALFGI